MDVLTAERLKLPHSGPVHPTPFLTDEEVSARFDKILARDFPDITPETQDQIPRTHTIRDVGRIALHKLRSLRSSLDVHRLAMVKFQNLKPSASPEDSWINRHPRMRRAAGFVGISALSTAAILLTRTTQAYALARHGIDLNFDTSHASLDHNTSTQLAAGHLGSVVAQHSESALHATNSSPGDWDDGVHNYGGVRVDDDVVRGSYRTAEPWPKSKDCAWNWAQQAIAYASHDAGNSDSQTQALAHDPDNIQSVMRSLVNSNDSIKNSHHHWLKAGYTYHATNMLGRAEDIVQEHKPQSEVSVPQPDQGDGVDPEPKPSTKTIDPPPPNPDIKDTGNSSNSLDVSKLPWWQQGLVSWGELNWVWPVSSILGGAAVGALIVTRRSRKKKDGSGQDTDEKKNHKTMVIPAERPIQEPRGRHAKAETEDDRRHFMEVFKPRISKHGNGWLQSLRRSGSNRIQGLRKRWADRHQTTETPATPDPDEALPNDPVAKV